MPRYAQPVHAPQSKKAASTPAERTKAQPARAQRGAIWHATQLRAAQSAAAASGAKAPSGSGLPSPLKERIERLSGFSMGDVRVRRNSSEPAKLGALAYAQGTDIHLGPGQEAHLPHEAWHVVQQKQGRVRATVQLETGTAVNDHHALEREADEVAAQLSRGPAVAQPNIAPLRTAAATAGRAVRQHKVLAKPNDYAESGGTRAIYFNVGEAQAKYWTKTIAQTAPSRPALLTAMAEQAALLGNAIGAQVSGTDPNTNKKIDWIAAAGGRNDAVNYEPVRASFTGKYEAPAARKDDPAIVRTLEIDYHYGSRAAGYVVRVHDSADAKAKDITFLKVQDHSTSFSHRHLKHVADTPLAALEKDPDAASKVAGEGARWKAVGKNAAKLRDASLLFTNEVPNKEFTTLVRTLPFNQLYLMWKSEFDMKYGIDDATVAKALQKPELKKTKGIQTAKVGEVEASTLDMSKDICLDTPAPGKKEDLDERAAVSLSTYVVSSFGKEFADEAKAVTTGFAKALEPFGAIGYANSVFSFGALTKGPVATLPKTLTPDPKLAFRFPAYRESVKAGPAKQKIAISAGDQAFKEARKSHYGVLITVAVMEVKSGLTPKPAPSQPAPAPVQLPLDLRARVLARFKWADGPLPADLTSKERRLLIVAEIVKEIAAQKAKPSAPSIQAPPATEPNSQAPKAVTQPAPVDAAKK